MSYWCDDAALNREQRKLDAVQADAKKRLDERRIVNTCRYANCRERHPARLGGCEALSCGVD